MHNHLQTTLFLTTLLLSQTLTASLNQPVRTQSGLVKGIPAKDKSITVFKGIPYAAPPIGDKRWHAPQPPPKWQGLRITDHFGPSCIQRIVEERKPWTHEFLPHGDVSEDCLSLNIWTPASNPNEKRPVLIFLHGGANVEGGGSIAVLSGEGLARKGLVTVTINYRLGVFGFFTHPELSNESANHASGNYGLLDQIAALKWVQNNIAAFGGDPQRITLAGQSAGAFDIANLILSPLAKGLFQRAILESGGAPGNSGLGLLTTSENMGINFARAKAATSLAQLRALSANDIIAPIPNTPSMRFGPVIDGYVVPSSPKTIFATARQNDIVTLTGTNADENGATPNPKITVEQFRAQAQRYGDLAAEFLNTYPVATDADAAARSNEAARDHRRVLQAEWAKSRSATSKTDCYLYFFNHVLPGPDAAQYGVFHSSELPYALNTLEESDRPFTAEDHKVADTMSTYWVNFATAGNPNGKGLPHWPSFKEQPELMMQIGTSPKPIPLTGSKAKLELMKKRVTQP